MRQHIEYQFFGTRLSERYHQTDVPMSTARELIGANTLAGFTPVVHSTTAKGDQLLTRDGRPLTVAAVHGSTNVWGALAIVHEG